MCQLRRWLLKQDRAAILEDLSTTSVDGSVIVYHFFSSDRKQESLQGVLRHLVVQALTQSPNVPPKALDLRKKKKHSNAEFVPKDLLDILVEIAKVSPNTYVILDGLDECMYLGKLVRHLPTLRNSLIKVLIASRDLPDIRKNFEDCPSLEVKASKYDIEHYVNVRLREDGEVDYELLEEDLKNEITSKIEKHADGS
jgi:hypothetical protein